MCVVVVELLHLVALRHQYLQVLFVPRLRWQVLQEQQRILETHAFQFFCKTKEQSSIHIAVELREPVFLREVRVPQPHNLVDAELSYQVATDPSVGKVHEVYVELVQVVEALGIGLLYQLLHFTYYLMDARL